MDFPPSLTPRSTKKASRNSDNNRRKENRSNKDDTPPQRRRNNDGSRGRNASGTARSNEVIVIDDGDDSDDNIKAAKKKSADDERKPAAKVSATVTSPKKQHQPRCISLLDEDDDSSVEEIQTNNMEVEAGRKRSRSNKVSMMVMNNVDSDRALAEKLQKKEEDAAARNSNNIAKANPLREQRLMARSTDGKAVLAVQEIMALVTETRNIAKKYKNYQLVNYIAAVTREDMFHFAKSMLELKQEFLRQKINGYIDVGYHYTDSRHMANIRQHGLLTKKDRDSQKVNSTLHGSVFGDGVYTANNPDNFSNYGNTGVLVARLTGNMVRVARSLHPNTKVDANTIVGDKMMTAMPMPSMPAMSGHHRQGQSLDKDGWPLNDDYHEIVLRSSAQYLPMISYDSRARQTKEGKECIENMEKGLQAIFDKLFNKGMKRSAYKDSEILKAPTASYNHPLPAFNGLNMGLPPASSSAILPPGFPAPLPGMPVPGMGPSIASGTFGRGSTTTTRSSLSMARQRMIGNVPSTTGGNNPLSSNATSSASNTLTYKAPTTLTTGIPSDAMSTPESSCNMEEDCVICQDPLHRRRKGAKLKCQHIFHKDCIQRAFQSKPECPTCRKSIGAPAGKCPSGTMTTTTSSMRCSGFREGSIVITYVIPAGRQMSYHDNPGTSHASKHVAAYIPNNTDGQALLKRLKYAFLHGLTFNVGTSLTTGQKNQCTWASIHHKTSPTGGVQAHGFPDPDYFKNCNAELDGLGVSPAHSLGEDGKEV